MPMRMAKVSLRTQGFYQWLVASGWWLKKQLLTSPDAERLASLVGDYEDTRIGKQHFPACLFREALLDLTQGFRLEGLGGFRRKCLEIHTHTRRTEPLDDALSGLHLVVVGGLANVEAGG